MYIDGKAIADGILESLKQKVINLKKEGITPTLAVILVGNDSGSLSYIKQKGKAAEAIGAKLILEHLPESTSPEALASTITHYNNDSQIHGLIVQRPVPIEAIEGILETVAPSKDVDGFIPNSPFQVPVAKAVITLLTHVHHNLTTQKLLREEFMPWLHTQHIAILGRGQTAGKPIATLLSSYGCAPHVIHSQTPDPQAILKKADIIISCVGKENVLTKSIISKGVILIAVGLTRGSDGKFHGDYNEQEIQDIASFYTPTPGGVGPVNVASLMQNLIDACILNTGGTL
jgi:methylenetetrahydrofolate dehydrogenase (NADP+) / methenyltetrahydrofolate cyclohydrolase